MEVDADVQALLADEKDFEFEAEIDRNPYRLKNWLRYLDSKPLASRRVRNVLHERALKFLPSSYKLWHRYLSERLMAVEGKSPADLKCQIVVNTFERSLVHMHRMPVIWVMYLRFLTTLFRGTTTRRAFDRALQALPITQHGCIWPLYLDWVKCIGVKETAIRVCRRYLMYEPNQREEYVDYLESVGEWEEAARQLAICVNDETFVSPKSHTSHQMWMRLCDLCASHPQEVNRGLLKVDAIIRSGLSRFTDEVGRLWCKLADYYIRLGQFERARDVYEEAINTVLTIRDFTAVFDAYSQFEESVLTAKMRMVSADDSDEEAAAATDSDSDLDEETEDIELRLSRLEHLLERRPLLVSSVLLRQNPHNVYEWQKRVKLFADKSDLRKVATCYAEAVKTVDAKLSVGKLCNLWIDFAKFYEDNGDVANSRVIFERALLPPYRHVDDLAAVWCAYADMELRHDNFSRALNLMRRATTEPEAAVERRRLAGGSTHSEFQKAKAEAPVQERVYKCPKVWNNLLDLEESLGTPQTTRAAYDRAIELKVCTVQMVLNYAAFLEENSYFEESFTAYEKGVQLFTFPYVRPIWQLYLDKFVGRFGGSKMERARDLFEQVLSAAPPTDAPEFYLRYVKLEEEHGLARNATQILDRACGAVDAKDRLDMFKLYIAKVEQFYGVTQTRSVYEKAIEALSDDEAREICLQFAELEKNLGEVDRSRAIYTHGSQFADPRRHESYWKIWHDFEVAYGNEETFREMLRIKRSVQMSFSAVNYMAADMTAADIPITSDAEALAAEMKKSAGRTTEAGTKRKAADAMSSLETGADKIRAVAPAAPERDPELGPERVNPEEIDIDEDDEGEINVVEKKVPEGVFGGVSQMGALERMRTKK